MIEFSVERRVSVEQFRDLLVRSTLGERRPIDEPETLAGMVANGNLLVTAWKEELLVGVARSVTDFSYCCYLSDLAVDAACQREGIGKELVRLTREQLPAGCSVILLSAPQATTYYPGIGFEQHPSAWVCKAGG